MELRKGNGTVTLRTLWCPLGPYYNECMQQKRPSPYYSEGSQPIKDADYFDCDQGCHNYMAKEAKKKVEMVIDEISEAESAVAREKRADRMEDMYDDLGDVAEERHGHEARLQE